MKLFEDSSSLVAAQTGICSVEELKYPNLPSVSHSLDPEGFVLIDPLMQLTLLIQEPKIAAKPGFYCGGICCTGSWYNPPCRIAAENPPELRQMRLFWADISSV